MPQTGQEMIIKQDIKRLVSKSMKMGFDTILVMEFLLDICYNIM